jgi:hypothetical protein
MRGGVLLFCGVVLALCLWLLLHNAKQSKGALSPAPATTPAATSASNPSLSHTNIYQGTTTLRSMSMTAPAAVISTLPTIATNVIDPGLLAAWQVPIEFYGKVEDSNSNSVAGALIHFRWSEKPTEDGMKTADTQSDSDGLFSLHGEKGRSLTVSFSKDGYHSLQRGERTFLYALGPDIITPDSAHPVIFHLQKAGTPEPLMRLASPMAGPRQYRLDSSGKPTDISFYSGKRITQGAAQLSVAYSIDTNDQSHGQFKWRCLISIPGGGIQPTAEELPARAPEQGYQETIEIASDPNAWSDRFEQAYYFYLPDGKYGRMKFSLVCAGNPSFGVEALINPSGSKNLEYDKYLSGNIMVDQSAP